MRYYFCAEACMIQWQQHRHDRDVVEWLKNGAGTRAKILMSLNNAERAKAESSSAVTGICDVDNVELPVQQD